jgi:hypothetical protein
MLHWLIMTAKYRRFTLQLNEESDADVIAYLEASSNATDAIRQALRAKMEAEE